MIDDVIAKWNEQIIVGYPAFGSAEWLHFREYSNVLFGIFPQHSIVEVEGEGEKDLRCSSGDVFLRLSPSARGSHHKKKRSIHHPPITHIILVPASTIKLIQQ